MGAGHGHRQLWLGRVVGAVSVVERGTRIGALDHGRTLADSALRDARNRAVGVGLPRQIELAVAARRAARPFDA